MENGREILPERAAGRDGRAGAEGGAPFIEFWAWHDGELLPATADELEWIHERERERAARWRLRQWWRIERAHARWEPVRRLRAALASGRAKVVEWLARWPHVGVARPAKGMRETARSGTRSGA